MKLDFYGKYFEDIIEYDFENLVKEFRVNTLYSYISSDFLQNYVNYIKNRSIILMFDEEYSVKKNKVVELILAYKKDFYVDFGCIVDKLDCHFDIVIFGETNNFYWFLWEFDSGRSHIGKIVKSKDINLQKMKNDFIEFEIKGYLIPEGWISTYVEIDFLEDKDRIRLI